MTHNKEDAEQVVDSETKKQAPAKSEEATQEKASSKKQNWFVEFLKTKKGKIITVVVAVVLLIAGLFIWPTTRYAILGTFIKKQVTVSVVDVNTGKPVSEVDVVMAAQGGKTDSEGKITLFNVPVGKHQLSASKKYYVEVLQNVEVGLFKDTAVDLQMQATGRQVPVKIINKVSGDAIANATITAADETTKTNETGEAVVVVPADQEKVQAKVFANGYNEADTEILVTEQQSDSNIFSLTPSGKLYFLSSRTGTVNVMKSNLDGSDPQVVVQGTGKEDSSEVSLLASRDWKYLALHALREGDKPKLYLIDTSTDKMTVMDEGDASFIPRGWSDHHFLYSVSRNNVKYWEDKKFALKSFNATNDNIVTIDESEANGSEYSYDYQNLGYVYIFGDNLTYVKSWSGYTETPQSSYIYSVKNDGSNKKELKSFAAKYANITAKLYEPKEEYFRIDLEGGSKSFWEYEQATGQFKEAADIDDSKFNEFYPTFLVSPSSRFTFWYEPRDGKNSLFVGDENAKDTQEVASLSEFTPYGWYSDDYLLMSKNGSELYIAPKDNKNNVQPLKITDYHKVGYSFSGYGYGYGGF